MRSGSQTTCTCCEYVVCRNEGGAAAGAIGTPQEAHEAVRHCLQACQIACVRLPVLTSFWQQHHRHEAAECAADSSAAQSSYDWQALRSVQGRKQGAPPGNLPLCR